MKVYFINSKKENCGVYQYGKRLWDVVQHSKLNMTYHEVENLDEFNSLDFSNVDVLFFNWIEGGLAGPFGWFNHSVAKKLKENYSKLKTITVMHTPDLDTVTFDYYIDQNPLKDGLTRPLYNFDITKPKKQHDIPHIGSFGFASEHKGFDDIVRLVNEQYDEAQINLHITKAHYGDEDGSRQNRVINQIKEISLKPKIKLNITTDFIGNEELLEFTHNNDIIVLAYKSGKDPSSLPDYPISTNTPIAITSIGMFSHIYDKNLDINLKTIPEILEYNKKTNYVGELRNKWSRETLCEEFENLINMIYNITNTTYSQVNQDQFVLKLIGENGYFLDLGAGWDHSGVNSNTLLLEENGWNGICIEGDTPSYNLRLEKAKQATVLNVYIPQTRIEDILKDNNAPKVIDYVSIDIDPMSIIALDNFPFDEYEFKVMTFEHDAYRNGPEQKEKAYSLLTEKGYVRLCNDVRVPESMGETNYFEDWYVNPKFFTEEFINNNTFDKCLGSDIVKNIK